MPKRDLAVIVIVVVAVAAFFVFLFLGGEISTILENNPPSASPAP